jgi:hypothetical protein
MAPPGESRRGRRPPSRDRRKGKLDRLKSEAWRRSAAAVAVVVVGYFVASVGLTFFQKSLISVSKSLIRDERATNSFFRLFAALAVSYYHRDLPSGPEVRLRRHLPKRLGGLHGQESGKLPAAKPTGLRVVQVVVVVVVGGGGGGGGQTYFFLFQIKLKSMRHLKILSNKIKIISNFHLNFVK